MPLGQAAAGNHAFGTDGGRKPCLWDKRRPETMPLGQAAAGNHAFGTDGGCILMHASRMRSDILYQLPKSEGYEQYAGKELDVEVDVLAKFYAGSRSDK